MSPDNKASQPLSSLTDDNQPSLPSAPKMAMTIVAEHVADTSVITELYSAHDNVTEAFTVLTTCEFSVSSAKESKIEKTTKGACFYKGIKLDLKKLLKENSDLERYDATKDSKKRVHVACKPCRQYIDEAKKYLRNETVHITAGVRADGYDHLQLIVDHLQSEAHNAVKRLDKE